MLTIASDPTFNSTFLMTYRSFATAEEVLSLLIRRYQLQPPPNLTPEQLKDWAERKQKPVKLRYVFSDSACLSSLIVL
jgi:son of sevenless-like protein